ncbi:MAG TPA: helix-turn-helix transcriptional regulator [Pseudonocardiaceae bacterium]|nr:helix-turn-helix transcriptional regulator [Pseudonocardiaceae bacterium]
MDEAAIAAILVSIGGQVRAARQQRGWFLADVAERLDLSASVICRMELARREPSVQQLILVCAVLGRRLSDMLRTAENEAFPLGLSPWTPPESGQS